MSRPNIDSKPSFTPEDAFNAADSASQLVNQYIVSPLADLGIAGFVFDVEDETAIDLTSDITDHYTENNTAIQDNIAVRPLSLTLSGFIGECVWRGQKDISTLQKLAQKITTISAYLPVITASARQAYSSLTDTSQNNSQYFASTLNTAVDFYKTFRTLNPPKTKQAQAFNYFRALQNARTKIGIDTPYSFLPNMVIERISAVQGGASKYISDFRVTFKQIRTVSTKTVKFDPSKYQGRTAGQASPVQSQGKVGGKKLSDTDSQSIFSKILDSGKSLFQ